MPAGVPSSLQLDRPARALGELERLILRTSPVSDESYAYCDRLVGATIDERPPPPAAGPRRRRRATVVATCVEPPTSIRVHSLVYDDDAAAGRVVDVILAAREYKVVGRAPTTLSPSCAATRRAAAAAARCATPRRACTLCQPPPEGLPVEFFLENVLSEVRRALRQAEAGQPPMTRAAGEDYGWRDRGWERGGAQFERTLVEKLRENGVGAVARRQTKHEAETLVSRLQGTMMVIAEAEEPSAADGDDADATRRRRALRDPGARRPVAPDAAAAAAAAAAERPSGERPSGGGDASAAQ